MKLFGFWRARRAKLKGEYNPLGVPRNTLAAARRAGLNYPDWYAGGSEPAGPRKKTFEDIVDSAKHGR